MHIYEDVARIVGTKGLDGRVIAECAPRCAFLFDGPDDAPLLGVDFHFVPPRIEGPRCALLRAVRSFDGSRAVLSFADIDDGGVSADLVGCHCLVSATDLEPYGDRIPSASLLLSMEDLPSEGFEAFEDVFDGWVVHDAETGFSGKVQTATCPAGQVLLEVSPDGGAGERSLLIPLADDLVESIDEEGERLEMRLPRGLLDL